MKKKIDFEKLIDGYVNYEGLYYKIIDVITKDDNVIGATAYLLCPANYSNAYTDLNECCGFFFKERDLLYDELYDSMTVVTKEEVVKYIRKITSDAIKKFL